MVVDIGPAALSDFSEGCDHLVERTWNLLKFPLDARDIVVVDHRGCADTRKEDIGRVRFNLDVSQVKP